jgi:hypothetical protein
MPPAQAAGKRKEELPLGQIASAKYPHGATYTINLRTMKQPNASSGYSRDVKIVPQVKLQYQNTSAGSTITLAASRNWQRTLRHVATRCGNKTVVATGNFATRNLRCFGNSCTSS